MKSNIVKLILFLSLEAGTLLTHGQILITKSDTVSLQQDSVIHLVLSPYRGNMQWQISFDSITWINIEEKTDTLNIKTSLQATYRAIIIDGSCDTICSEIADVTYTKPSVTTERALNITYSTALLGGKIIHNGGQNIIEQGICLGYNRNPTIDDFKIIIKGNTAEFDTTIYGLTSNTIYYFRAYAINPDGLSYGIGNQFTTEELTFSLSKTITAEKEDTIFCPDNSLLIISGNTLNKDDEIKIEKNNSGYFELENPDFTILGNTISIHLPINSINGTIYYVFDLPQYLDTLKSMAFFLFNGNSYYPLAYKIQDKKVIVEMSSLKWDEIKPEKDLKSLSSFLSFLIIPLQLYEQPPKKQMGLKEVTLADKTIVYNEPTLIQNSRTLLFIHGWIGAPSTWDEMILKVLSEPDFENCKIWTFGYNSSLGISENATILSTYLTEYTNNKKVDIIAHSMGGLVSRSMLEYYIGHKWVSRLIAIGTPNLGSPLAALKLVLGEVGFITEYFVDNLFGSNLDINSQGFTDLDENSAFIQNMKKSTNFQVPYFLIAAKNDPSIWPPSNDLILNGDDDGIVTVNSAFGIPDCLYSPIIHIPKSQAHTIMPKDSLVYKEVLKYLRLNLSLPRISTSPATSITNTAATLNGNVTSDGGAPVTQRGFYWCHLCDEPGPGDSTTVVQGTTGQYSYRLSNLVPDSRYAYKAFAKNSIGTATGNIFYLVTGPAPVSLPTITTSIVTSITQTTATGGGNVTADGGTSVTSRGVCWGTSQNPVIDINDKTTDGPGTGTFTSSITGLNPGTKYYVRAYATNSKGTAYGNEQSFTTAAGIETGTVTDIDGNVYKTVKIGNQWWMAENLKVTRYRNGDPVPHIPGNNEWAQIIAGAYCSYNNDASYHNKYGLLYNWHVVDDNRNIAPEGWHVASDAEWETLATYAGGRNITGGKLKNTDNTFWLSPNTDATNLYGFNALPGGYRRSDGAFGYEIHYGIPGTGGHWWSSTIVGPGSPDAWGEFMYFDKATMPNYGHIQGAGFSIRCVMDSQTSAILLPSVNTSQVSGITSGKAQCGGAVSSDGGASITARGVCWNTSGYPTTKDHKTVDGSGTGSFISLLSELSRGTEYFVRAYATNSKGTAYGEPLRFTTSAEEANSGTFTDARDGKTYKWVKIGQQVWMAENLVYLPQINRPGQESHEIPYYCVYGYTGSNIQEAKATDSYSTFGVLYNWPAAVESCPAGWHLPTKAEWNQLALYVNEQKGPYEVNGAYWFNTGGHLKATSGWDNNGNGTDDFGFSALPGGYYGDNPPNIEFTGIGNSGYWWSESNYWFMYNFTSTLYGLSGINTKANCYSVRCIRDH